MHRISIIPRGRALGYTLNLPEEDRYLNRATSWWTLTVLLGGRVAEEVVFGRSRPAPPTTCKRVADIACAMIHEYAMGTGFTSLRVNSEDAVGDHTPRARRGGPRTGRRGLPARATVLLRTHRVQLDGLAAALLDDEVLERKEIDRIMAGHAGHRARIAAPAFHLGIAAATTEPPVEPTPPAEQ